MSHFRNSRPPRRKSQWLSLLALPAILAVLLPAGRGVQAQTGTEANRGVHPQPAPSATAVRLSAPITLDGKLDEEVWRTAAPATDFRQSQPDEGKAATQRTEVRFAFDESAIYVGARMYDSLGAAGVRSRLVRRDALSENDSDLLQVLFDSYHSHVFSYNFTVNPAGAKRDAQGGDATWDAVWESATMIDSLGWTAELRIPYSQINFSTATAQLWGLQVVRFAHRLNERTHFAWWPNNESGGPPRYGHLEGISITSRPRGFEVLPYTVARSRHIRPSDASNPFTSSSDTDFRVGGDLKARLTSNLTLNATFNPDFGQVEVDPAVVNLSAFETFFQERRPFFVENQSAFSFGNFNCFFCSNVSSLQMFYSRRIGRSPQIFPSGTYVDQPENATILAAGKVTGRTASNYQIGIMSALTRREQADVIIVDGETRQELSREVEPLTNHFVMRPRKDFRGGQFWISSILTSVDRFTDDSVVQARIPRSARGLGVEWYAATNDRSYTFMGQYALSDVRGTPTAMERLQRSSARYFQRPDREGSGNGLFSDLLDPSVTNLTGYGGYARAAKEAGTWIGEAMVNYRSPGFEVNDMAFLNKSDYFYMNANLARSVTKPGPIYRNYFAVIGSQQEFNYDGDRTDRQFIAGLFGQLRNYWQLNGFVIRTPEAYDDRATRGGPTIRKVGYTFLQGFLGTDQRKAISASTNPNYTFLEHGLRQYRLNLSMTYKPSANVQLSGGPSFSASESPAQFVTSGADSTHAAFFGRRYIFGQIARRELSMSTRANVTFTPNLTLEAFVQPLIASGDYKSFREYVAPRQAAFRDFGPSEVTESVIDGATRYTIDVDGSGPAQPISFFNPDFNFRSLRGNAVLRWEYRPGSTLFFVWQQSRSEQVALGDFDFGRDRRALFTAKPDNIFLVKATYWLAF